MPSTQEITIATAVGTVFTVLISAALELSAFQAILVALGLSVNYWAGRGLWKSFRGRRS